MAKIVDTKKYFGLYWATYQGQRDIWSAIGEYYEGGEQNFQRLHDNYVTQVSNLSNIVKCEEGK